jgi:hypothetical protein
MANGLPLIGFSLSVVGFALTVSVVGFALAAVTRLR